jgi:hypothetical protein
MDKAEVRLAVEKYGRQGCTTLSWYQVPRPEGPIAGSWLTQVHRPKSALRLEESELLFLNVCHVSGDTWTWWLLNIPSYGHKANTWPLRLRAENLAFHDCDSIFLVESPLRKRRQQSLDFCIIATLLFPRPIVSASFSTGYGVLPSQP